MIRGISCKINKLWGDVFKQIVGEINLKKYTWKVVDGYIDVYNIERLQEKTIFDKDLISGEEFMDFIKTENDYNPYLFSIQGSLKKFFKVVSKYYEYKKSPVEIIIMITDSEWLDIYSKDIDIIKTIEKNLINNKNFYDIELITDENDSRTSFKL